MKIEMKKIKVEYNPRTVFNKDKVMEESIQKLGLIQPLTVVADSSGMYTLLDGERRYRACKKLGVKEVEVTVKEYNEQEQKEIPILTDLTKNLLSIGDKAMGIANLVNKEKKFTADGIAKLLDMKKKEVADYIKIGSLHPKVLEVLNKGGINRFNAVRLAEIGREDIQIKVAQELARNVDYDFDEVIDEMFYSLPFDDVFTYEQAKADNKIGITIKDQWGKEWVYTFDEAYYNKVKSECNERYKASYKDMEDKKGNKAKEKALTKAEIKKEKEERKKVRSKAEEVKAKQLELLKENMEKFLTKKVDEKVVAQQIEYWANGIPTDLCKMILQAYGVEYVAKDMDSGRYKKATADIIRKYVKNEKQLVNLVEFSLQTREQGMEVHNITLFNIDGFKKFVAWLNRRSK